VQKINDDVNISWPDIADNETGYIIEISYDGINFEELTEVTANETIYSFPTSQLTNEMAYFRMYAKSPTGCPSAYIHTAFIDLTINENKNIASLHLEIFPNPVADVLEIKMTNESISKIQLYNPDGKNIQADFHNNKLNLSGLTDGIYFIKIDSKTGRSFMKRFVKI